MRNQTIYFISVTFLLLIVASSVMAADTERVLFRFDKPEAASQWQTVNDGVMGGVSDGRFKINDDKNMEFFGTLSLENNGGFASVRSRSIESNLKTGDSIAARVRGDGREYTVNLYVPRGSGGYSFRQTFKTRKSEWIEVSFPVDKFVATYRGRVFPDQKLDPSKVNSIGFLLGDKQAGPFQLEVEWIKVRSGSAVNAAIPSQREMALFDGKTIEGWTRQGGTATYEAKDGMIVGTTVDGSRNTFLCKGPFSDFILELEVLCDKELNSGVQIRSHTYEKDTPQMSQPERIREKGEVYGYQCEIAAAASECSGNFWDEGRRTKWLDDFSNKPEARKAFRDGQWNHYRIVAQGNRIRSWVNQIPCADFRDDMDATGLIGLQVHGIKKGTGPYQVRWRNIKIRELKPGEEVN